MMLTERKLGFISDPELTNLITEVLSEIDRVYEVQGYRSTLFLAVSAIEGILKHILKINRDLAIVLPQYPKDKKGNKKKLSAVSFEDVIKLCSKMDLIPKELEVNYNQIRKYRNFIHPERQLKEKKEIYIGISQLALAVLNTTLKHLETKRFIEHTYWDVISGNPVYLLNNRILKLETSKDGVRTHSFITTTYLQNKEFTISFDLYIPDDSIFNFVYNMESEERFRMIRIDTRPKKDEGLLICPSEFSWYVKDTFTKPTNVQNNRCKVEISHKSKVFKFKIDGHEMKLKSQDYGFNQAKPIGFFNELRQIELENFSTQ